MADTSPPRHVLLVCHGDNEPLLGRSMDFDMSIDDIRKGRVHTISTNGASKPTFVANPALPEAAKKLPARKYHTAATMHCPFRAWLDVGEGVEVRKVFFRNMHRCLRANGELFLEFPVLALAALAPKQWKKSGIDLSKGYHDGIYPKGWDKIVAAAVDVVCASAVSPTGKRLFRKKFFTYDYCILEKM